MKKNLREKEQSVSSQPSKSSKGQSGPDGGFISQLKSAMGNTPQAQEMAQLQTGADQYTSQLKEDRQTSKTVGDGMDIAQLKPLSKGKLNVIGENHNESDARREQERTFVMDETSGGDYWEEEQFKIVVQGQETEADPLIYKVLADMHRIETLARHAIIKIKEEDKDTAEEKRTKMNNMARLAHAQWSHIEGIPYTGNLSAEQVETRDKLMKERVQKMDDCVTAVNNVCDGSLNADKAAPTVKAFTTTMKGVMEEPKLNKLRSKAMHEAAEGAAAKKGAWKVGDFHISDIETLLEGAAPGYNLMTRGEFNDELKKKEQ